MGTTDAGQGRLKYAANSLATSAVLLAPMLLNTGRLAHPSPWLFVLANLVVYWTQPSVAFQAGDEARRADRRSVEVLLYANTLVCLAVVAEFALRPVLSPEPLSPWVWGGAAVMAAGIAFRVWAIRTLGEYFTSVVYVAERQPVIQHGPYRSLRHPSYTGVLVVYLGAAILFQSLVAVVLLVAVIVPAYLYRIRVEEAALVEKLGAAYAEYRGRTSRLLPGL